MKSFNLALTECNRLAVRCSNEATAAQRKPGRVKLHNYFACSVQNVGQDAVLNTWYRGCRPTDRDCQLQWTYIVVPTLPCMI